MKEKIGFVGLGLMGEPMALQLLNSGYGISIFNRTKQKADLLLSRGATWCVSPAAVASQSEIVFSMVSTPNALKEVSLGKDGILSTFTCGSIHVDCSTISPELSMLLAEQYRAKECSFLHSPVLGSVPQVKNGSLLLFVGGDKEAYSHVESVLRIFGSHIWHFERAEQATIMKLLCNSFISGMVVVLSQALILAKKSDIDPRTLLEIIASSQLNAPLYQSKGLSIIERNFTPRFYVEHLLKDTNLILDVAKSLNIPLPMSETAQTLFKQAVDLGLAKEDYSSVVRVLEKQAKVEVS